MAGETPLQPGPVRAPELDGAGWLNVPAPLTLRQLRGKVVVLDFWTYGCINCLHVLADLKKLEARFPDELVVVGVHSAKYANERDLDNLRQIVVRYGIEHPVVNDPDMTIWRAYAARAWPTRVIIDPAGYVVGTATGEGNYDGFVQAIATVARVFEERGELDRRPLPLRLERGRTGDMPLAFPGKVLADPSGGRVFVADTNHHRIVVAAPDGTIRDIAGSGLPGDGDGIFTQARFRGPQGLALVGDTLYVADTGNHRIRAVDLAARTVETVAGTGRQAGPGAEGGAALESDLSSPWDLAAVEGILIVAMAGLHQLWVMDLLHGQIYPWAGTGGEARQDGSVAEATFAQPSGLALRDRTLYVADAESNIVRAVALPPVNEVRTLAGGNLFDFGDADGHGDAVRLQHPLGLAIDGERVFVADTYNHRIKVLDPASRRVAAFAGAGSPGFADGGAGDARFHEPGGLSAAGGRLYVADTNNHAVRVIDLASGETRTLALNGLRPPGPEQSRGAGWDRVAVDAGRVRLRAGGDGAIVVTLGLGGDEVLNPFVAHEVRLTHDGHELGSLMLEAGQDGEVPHPIRIPFSAPAPGRMSLGVEVDAFVCRRDHAGPCRLVAQAWVVDVEVTDQPDAQVDIELAAPAAETTATR